MPLQLPEYEPVIFEDSPLAEVVCQLRFNPILKIATTSPAEFQDAVRRDFPLVVQERGIGFAFTGNQPVLTASNEPVWQFRSADEKWVLSITSTFIALKTTAYEHIEDFLGRLMPVVAVFERLYAPESYNRVGLRYVNRIVMPKDGAAPVPWHQILNPHVASMYGDAAVLGAIVEGQHHLILESEHGQIGWRYSSDVGQADEAPAERFTLDFDHYLMGQIAPGDVRAKLVGFNLILYRLFRWCLTPNGFELLKPRSKQKEAL